MKEEEIIEFYERQYGNAPSFEKTPRGRDHLPYKKRIETGERMSREGQEKIRNMRGTLDVRFN